MIVRNKFSRVPDFNSFLTSVGEKFHVLFDSRLNEDGTIRLIESGREDIQAKINSHASSCDMSVIIRKLQLGDTSVLTSKQPMYGDFTQFPTSYAEVLDLVNRSDKAFTSLDPEVRAQFDNDKSKWFAAIGSPMWLEAMGFNKAPATTVNEGAAVE